MQSIDAQSIISIFRSPFSFRFHKSYIYTLLPSPNLSPPYSRISLLPPAFDFYFTLFSSNIPHLVFIFLVYYFHLFPTIYPSLELPFAYASIATTLFIQYFYDIYLTSIFILFVCLDVCPGE